LDLADHPIESEDCILAVDFHMEVILIASRDPQLKVMLSGSVDGLRANDEYPEQ
jgi:hypothetical protein